MIHENDNDEDCPSFIDEMEFDEDHPVTGNHNLTENKDVAKEFQSTTPII